MNREKHRAASVRKGMNQTVQKKDGDEEMRRDTGLAVWGVGGREGGDRRCLPSYSPFSVVFTTLRRLLPPSFPSISP